MQAIQSGSLRPVISYGNQHRRLPRGMSLRSWPERDISPEALAFAVREMAGQSRISRNRLITQAGNLDKGELDRSIELLMNLGIIQRCEDHLRYQEAPQGKLRDFLAISLLKKVRVSNEGHRSASLRGFLMALREDVAERKCGSFVWRDKMPAPKYTLLPPKRWSPLGNNYHNQVLFGVEKQNKNDMMFKLKFDPPLGPGELISYGFYIWNRNHYSQSRKEALERYKDEWIREGLAITDPTVQARIAVQLPDGYAHQRAVAEKNPVLTIGGPNVPGVLVEDLHDSRRTLNLGLNRPASGHYFVSWVPPE